MSKTVNNNHGKLVVITGYPASGQDTMMNMLLESRPEFHRIITHTDRPIRPNEVNGVDYHFVTTKKFKQMIQEELFFEYVMHGSHYKGTVKKEFTPILAGNNVVWRIDVIRAAILEETMHEKFERKVAEQIVSRMYKFIIKPESKKVAHERYRNRDPNFDENEFNKRYQLVENVFSENSNKFPHVITNKTGRQNDTLGKIEEILNRK
jgi:guanylate kinase